MSVDLELLRAYADDAKARGLSGEQTLAEAIEQGLLTFVPCPVCRGDGCKRCNGDGFGFQMKKRGQA